MASFINTLLISESKGWKIISDDNIELKLNSGILRKIKIEWVLFAIFIIVLLKFMAVFDGGLLLHEAPYNYAAGDMFTFAVYADFARFENDLTRVPTYISQGITGVVTSFSMIGSIIAAELAQFIGAESYDFIIHLSLVFIVLSILIIFEFLRKIDVRLAVLSLPLSLLVFKWPFQYTITWGMQISNINMIFVVISLFCLLYLNKRYMFIVLGIMNGAGFLAHARETLMFNTAVALYFLVRFIKEKIPQEIIKNPSVIKTLLKENETVVSFRNYLFSIPVMMMMMYRHFPFLFILLYEKSAVAGYGTSNYLIAYMPPWLRHHVYFLQFGFFEYIIYIGVIISLYFLIFKKLRIMDIIIAFGIMFMFNGFFSILGNKTTQIRHLFPILLMPLVGLALYLAYSSIKKSIKIRSALIFAVLFLLVLIPTVAYHSPEKVSEYAFSDPYTWEGMKWVRSNVADNEKVLVLYGDRYGQESMFYMMLKNQFRTWQEWYLEQVSKKNLSSTVVASGVIMAEYIVKSESGRYVSKDRAVFSRMRQSLCDYDYIYSDKISRYPQVQEYTAKLLNKLIKENKFVIVFQNDLVVILKNNNVGGECFKDEVLA